MKRRLLFGVVAAAGFVLLVGWYLRPERRLHRSWHQLLDVVEARHARALGSVLADTYHDRWGYTREGLIEDARLGFMQLDALEIRVQRQTFHLEGERATVSAILRVDVRGSRLADAARVAANSLVSPCTFTWVREDSFPWGWRLESFDQPELDLARLRRQTAGY